jgi:hypothetical protein
MEEELYDDVSLNMEDEEIEDLLQELILEQLAYKKMGNTAAANELEKEIKALRAKL